MNEEPESLFGSTETLLRAFSVCDIADDRNCQGLSAGLERAEHDIYREFAAVFAETVQFEPCPHRARVGLSGVLRPTRWVTLTKSFGNKDLDGLPNQFLWVVAEETLDLRVCLQDSPITIDNEDRVRGELKQFLI